MSKYLDVGTNLHSQQQYRFMDCWAGEGETVGIKLCEGWTC